MGFFVVLYQKYGNLENVDARITDHQIITADGGFDGIITVCDSQEHCGTLEVARQWQYARADLERFLNEKYTLNSTLSCYHYAKRPEVYLRDGNSNWAIAMAIMTPFGCLLIATVVSAIIVGWIKMREHSYLPLTTV